MLNSKLLFFILPALLVLADKVIAVPLYSKDVFCGTEQCGTMEIDKYEGYYLWNSKDPSNTDFWRGSALIDGQFVRPAGGYSGFHYVQTVTVDERPPAFTDGTPLTTPYVDTPPGGYSSKSWDFLLYYDERGEFPNYFDQPTNSAIASMTQPDRTLSLSFETWLVCLIDETLGMDPNSATDDYYQIAPLLGWTWGFDIKYDPDGDAFLELLEDFDILLNPFAWLNMPTADWSNSLNQRYGTGVNTEYFIVDVGDCEDCTVPEPGVLALFSAGMVGLVVARRKKMQPARNN